MHTKAKHTREVSCKIIYIIFTYKYCPIGSNVEHAACLICFATTANAFIQKLGSALGCPGLGKPAVDEWRTQKCLVEIIASQELRFVYREKRRKSH
ncbi:hypothetical protein GJ496_011429 [Pomphorhynchus laevis]|nr:hypothetical protein GJ496_011429 [Pomphorhynchus laevis]